MAEEAKEEDEVGFWDEKVGPLLTTDMGVPILNQNLPRKEYAIAGACFLGFGAINVAGKASVAKVKSYYRQISKMEL